MILNFIPNLIIFIFFFQVTRFEVEIKEKGGEMRTQRKGHFKIFSNESSLSKNIMPKSCTNL
jgi:hypothetical protein